MSNKAVTTGKFHGVGRSEVQLSYLPSPDFLDFKLPTGYIVLLTGDGSTLTETTAKELKAKGHSVVVLNLPTINPTKFTNHITLTETSDDAIQSVFAEITQRFGKIGSFIHLHPHFEFQSGNFAQHFSKERQILKTIFLLAKHLQGPLNELAGQLRAGFLTVSRMDGALGLGKRNNVSVIGGGLPGLVKCLNLEWSSVFCRAVDIQPELEESQIANNIVSEYHDVNVGVLETAVSTAGRFNLVAKPVTLTEGAKIETTVTKETVFLVSGGAKGVTATCVVEMAKAFQCKFILLGRSDADFQLPKYAYDTEEEGTMKRLIMEDFKARGEKPSLPAVKKLFNQIAAKKEIDATLTAINEFGGQAIYLKGDVTNPSTFKTELLKATQKFGTVNGVIHGAGRLADKYIQDKTPTDFDNVLSVKLDGLLSLMASVNIHKLDHLVLFSSVAGFYGNVGQTDYAIANEILSKAAHQFKTNHPNTKVSAINWGAWDSGMVSGELKVQFEAAGVKLVNSEGGAALMVNEFNQDYDSEPQVVIGETLPTAVSYLGDNLQTYKLLRHLNSKKNPFLDHHVIQGNPVLPIVNAVGWMAGSCEQLYPDFKIHKIENTKLFKGLVFDGTAPQNFTIEIKETKKSSEEISFQVKISSPGKKLPVYHYQAEVHLVPKKMKLEAPIFKPTLSGNFSPKPGDKLYVDGTLFHGPFYQGIDQIQDFTDQQMILACTAPEIPLSEQGQFPVISANTFFADIQYQGMVVWVAWKNDGAKSLPLRTDRVTLYEPMKFGQKLWVHVAIKESNEFMMMADCTVYDENGKVYAVTENGAVTISKDLQW